MVKSVVIALLSIIIVVLMMTTFVEERTIYYNCDIAEFHPDIPIEVKKQCRALRTQRKVI